MSRVPPLLMAAAPSALIDELLMLVLPPDARVKLPVASMVLPLKLSAWPLDRAMSAPLRLPKVSAPFAALRLMLPSALSAEARLRSPPLAVTVSAPPSLMPWPAERLTDWPLTLRFSVNVPLP